MKPHPHAKLMAEYAKDAAETESPWERWQFRYEETAEWQNYDSNPIWDPHPSWRPDRQYRRKPRTININGHEVPEPMREAPEMESEYYVAETCCNSPDRLATIIWRGDDDDMAWLSNGLCHATKEAAIAHSKALLSFTQKQP